MNEMFTQQPKLILNMIYKIDYSYNITAQWQNADENAY